MKAALLSLSLVATSLLSACSAETIKQSAYGTLQNKADMDCRSQPGAKCPEQKSYDEYQRDLNAPQQKDK